MLSPQEPDQLVFVYGTLRRGGSNAFRMDGAEFVSPGRIEGSLYTISWYPGLVPGEGAGWVKGDIFKVGPGQLRALDEFEGLSAGEIEGSEYRRVKVPVWLDGVPWEESHRAWVYEWMGPVEDERRIVSGDWLEVEQPPARPVFTRLTVAAACCLPFPFFAGWMQMRAGAFPGTLPVENVLAVSIYGIPVAGIVASRVAARRREPQGRRRGIAAGMCFVWLLIWLYIGLAIFL